jgi:tagatose 6-phosphate kinase
MFICVSLNPGIDKRLRMSKLVPGRVHRAQSVESFPGGKAAHVAMVLRTLGATPHWLGLCGGATGAELVRGLSAYGIEVHACETHQPTRTNLEILGGDGTVTEILEPGCAPSAEERAAFENMLKKILLQKKEDIAVIFSGSLPAGASNDLYACLVRLAQQSGGRTFIDTSGEPLRQALAARPDFVKPNREEAAALLGTGIDSLPLAVDTIRKLIGLGAKSAALSLGAEGMLFCPAENAPVLLGVPPALRARSAVGSGDSALAGFAQAILGGCTVEECLRLATACAAANCLADSPGAARLEDIHRFQKEIRIEAVRARS